MRLDSPAAIVPPPRRLPLRILVAALFATASAQVGWALLGVGMFLFWVLVLHADFTALAHGRARVRNNDAEILTVERSGFSVGGGSGPHGPHHPGRSINRIEFRFVDPEGQTHSGVSYSTDTPVVGRTRQIEYPPGRPELARIMGMRNAPFTIWVSLFGIMPLVGAIFVLGSLRGGRRTIRLLTQGVATTGRVIDRRRTAVTVNDRRVWKFTLLFRDADGLEHTATVRTTKTDELKRHDEHTLLYDPVRPSRALVPGGAAAFPGVDDAGQLAEGRRTIWLALIVPLLTVVGHGAYALLRYGG